MGTSFAGVHVPVLEMLIRAAWPQSGSEMASAPANDAIQRANQLPDSAGSLNPLHTLIEAILDRHHAYLKTELPELEQMIEELCRGDAPNYRAKATELLRVFARFRRELESHMKREEVTLFPLIRRLEIAFVQKQPLPQNSFGPLSNAIAFMNEDHDFEDKLLRMMSELTNGYESPTDASPKYTELMGRLNLLADDMESHVQIEDEVLFPQAVLIEETRIV